MQLAELDRQLKVDLSLEVARKVAVPSSQRDVVRTAAPGTICSTSIPPLHDFHLFSLNSLKLVRQGSIQISSIFFKDS